MDRIPLPVQCLIKQSFTSCEYDLPFLIIPPEVVIVVSLSGFSAKVTPYLNLCWVDDPLGVHGFHVTLIPRKVVMLETSSSVISRTRSLLMSSEDQPSEVDFGEALEHSPRDGVNHLMSGRSLVPRFMMLIIDIEMRSDLGLYSEWCFISIWPRVLPSSKFQGLTTDIISKRQQKRPLELDWIY